MDRLDIASMTKEELETMLLAKGQPKFRGKQIFQWIHEKQVTEFSAMTNLPKSLVASLEESCELRDHITTLRKLTSAMDGTVKCLFRLSDGELVESVLMRYEHGLSACLSTQVGCKMGCTFCASTKAGFVRNLTPSEILGQLYALQRESGERVSTIVLMGIGEPLDNYDGVMRFLELVSDPEGNGLSLRHVSLSTCGLVEKIDALAEKKLGLTLSVSLHAPNDSIRRQTMPVAKKYPMEELLAACRRYTEATSRRISFEYALIAGVNDSRGNAEELAERLKGMLCHVNLIPVNEIRETDYRHAGKERIYEFQAWLQSHGINTTVRRTLGADIGAACGQLRRDYAEQEDAN